MMLRSKNTVQPQSQQKEFLVTDSVVNKIIK